MLRLIHVRSKMSLGYLPYCRRTATRESHRFSKFEISSHGKTLIYPDWTCSAKYVWKKYNTLDMEACMT